MPRALKASEQGLEPHWKVRVVLPGAVLHFASQTEPKVGRSTPTGDRWVAADWIDGPDYGDTIGFIDWQSVKAVTWRWSP
jgi:hypothetical protein